ncbi:MAG: LCCL domain-containing protein [Dokdonella sp.]
MKMGIAWVGYASWCGVALALSVCALIKPTLAQSRVQRPQTLDWQTSPLDLDLRGMNGERYEFLCPPGKPQPSRVVGDGIYTDDSSICTAAVHAGVIYPKAGGRVAIEIRRGQQSYAGADRNYVESNSYAGPWSGSFVVITPADATATHSH